MIAAVEASGASAQGEATLELIRLFVILLGASALVAWLSRRIALPYTVALVALGIGLGSFARPLRFEVTPELVLVVLLPGLIFEAAYHTDFQKLWTSLPSVALLAGPGVLITALVVAATLNAAAGLPFAQAFVVGAMISATDPVAVIATFRQLKSPGRLSTIVEAESLFNDGTGIVLFAIAVDFIARPAGPLEIVGSFVAVVLLSTIIGLIAGYLASRILPFVGDHLIEVALSVVLAYGTYLLADALHQSGVIAAAVAGLMLGTYGRRIGLSEVTVAALDSVWDFVAFLLTALVFLLIGFTLTLSDLAGAAAAIAWAAIAALAARALIVYGLLGPLQRVRGHLQHLPRTPGAAELESGPLPVGWLHVIFWAGLRGAVSTALALALPADFPNRSLLQGITLGVVLFTLLVQATTVELVVARWGRAPEVAAEAADEQPNPVVSEAGASADAVAGSGGVTGAATPPIAPPRKRQTS